MDINKSDTIKKENNDQIYRGSYWLYQKYGNLKIDVNIPDEIFPKEIIVKEVVTV